MATKTRAELKAYFQTGDKPTQTEFENLIDGIPNNQDQGGTESELHFIKKSLTAAEIKTLNSVPVDIGIPNPGAGKAIFISRANIRYNYVSAAFTSTTLNLITAGATANQGGTSAAQSILTQTVNIFSSANVQGSSAGSNSIVTNAIMNVTANADSGVGDSTVDLYVWYFIVTA